MDKLRASSSTNTLESACCSNGVLGVPGIDEAGLKAMDPRKLKVSDGVYAGGGGEFAYSEEANAESASCCLLDVDDSVFALGAGTGHLVCPASVVVVSGDS